MQDFLALSRLAARQEGNKGLVARGARDAYKYEITMSGLVIEFRRYVVSACNPATE